MAIIATSGESTDGRPLYAYKWHDAYYEQLKTEVRAQLSGALRGRGSTVLRPCFAYMRRGPLRRRHAGGPWAWETVFAEIGHATPTASDYITSG